MEKVFLVVLLCLLVFQKVSASNETFSMKLNSQVFQYLEELLMSQNIIELTDGVRMKKKSSEIDASSGSEGEGHQEDCGLLTMREFEINIDKIMNNFMLEFDLSRAVVKG